MQKDGLSGAGWWWSADLSQVVGVATGGPVPVPLASAGSRPSGNIETPTSKLLDSQWLTLGIGACVKYLGCHARDRAAAGGLTTIRATISPLDQRGVVLMSDLGWPAEQVGSQTLYGYNAPVADAAADMDDLCTDDRHLGSSTGTDCRGSARQNARL